MYAGCLTVFPLGKSVSLLFPTGLKRLGIPCYPVIEPPSEAIGRMGRTYAGYPFCVKAANLESKHRVRTSYIIGQPSVRTARSAAVFRLRPRSFYVPVVCHSPGRCAPPSTLTLHIWAGVRRAKNGSRGRCALCTVSDGAVRRRAEILDNVGTQI